MYARRIVTFGAPAARAALHTLAAAAPPLVGAAFSLLLLLSVAGADRAPAAVPLGIGLLLALAVWRPPAALQLAAAAIPLSWWITRAAGLLPLRLAEAIALAALAGACLRLAARRGAAQRTASGGAPGCPARTARGGTPRGTGSGEAPAWPGATRTPVRRRGALPAGVRPAAAAVLAVAGAAALVDLAPARAGLAGAWLIATDAVSRLSTGYLWGAAPAAPGLADAARLAAGVGLLLVVVAWSRRSEDLPRRLAVASVAGAAGAAAINLGVGADALLATDQPARMLLRELAGGRLTLESALANLHVTGEYFLLSTCVGVGLAAGRRCARLYGAAALATGAAFWIVGSRTQLAAAGLTALAAGALWLRPRLAPRWRGALAAAALLAGVSLPVAIVTVYSQRTGVFDRAAAGDGELAELAEVLYAETSQHVRIRTEFAAASLRMWATEPVFGVGPGRYRELSARFMSPWLLGIYPDGENAHNNYLQIAAELGAVGLAAFVWLLAALGWSVWRAVRAGPPLDPLLAGAAAGTAAFLVASLTGHPLLLGETAYPFWIAAGIAAAIADRRQPPAAAGVGRNIAADVRDDHAGARRLAAGWTIAPLLFLVVTLPARIDGAAQARMRATAADGLDGLGGVFAVETERPGGIPFRWTGPRATLFAPGGAARVRIPLRAPQARPDRPVAVDVAVDGRRVARVPLPGPTWVEVVAPLGGPPAADGFRRVDLIVDPPWPARDRGNGDPRTLGVQLRAVSVVR